MSSTKRVSGDYNIYANNTIFNGNLSIVSGNLVVSGTTTTVNSTDTYVKDRFMTLNAGESGSGITGGSPPSAGIEVDRGLNPKVSIRYNESTTKWEITNDGTTYLAIASGSISVAGANTYVQFNDGGSGFGADSSFTFDKSTKTLALSNISLNGSTISTITTNKDLTIDPNGSGSLIVNATVKLANQGSDPSSSSGNTWIYGKTPGNAGSGVYFVNTSASDELISKKRAQFYSWIF